MCGPCLHIEALIPDHEQGVLRRMTLNVEAVTLILNRSLHMPPLQVAEEGVGATPRPPPRNPTQEKSGQQNPWSPAGLLMM